MPRVHDQHDKNPLQLLEAQAGAAVAQRREQLRGDQGFAEQESALAPVQMKGGAAGAQGVQEAAARGVAGPGQALPYQQQIQAAFGPHDVSNVQAHTDARAADASQAMGANAYATGNHVAFGSAPDLFTAAHEAAHAVQQRAGVSLPGGVGRVGDAYEQHADAVAERVVQGKSAADLLGAADKSGGAAASVQRLAVQMDQATTQTPANDNELLPGNKAASAVAYNKGKGLKPAVWQQIATVVGSSSAAIDEELVRKIAAWQHGKGLDADGKVGDITMQWLSMEPAGKGLDAFVKANDILYLGMNPASRDKESSLLASQGAKVTAIKGSKEQGHLAVDGADVDLGTEDGVKAFVDSLKGLPDGKKQQLTTFLKSADFMAKDELAEMARQLYRAETGQCLFKRVVLSGHSGGWSFWGDDNGYIPFSSLAVLHQIFPIATGQVEDLCMSACNTGQKGKLDQYKAIFPNVKSIWAYVGYSPDASSGSLRHVGNWEQASRGSGTNEEKLNAAREKVGRGGGKNDKHVAVYTNDQAGKESYATDSEYAAKDYETIKGTVDSQMGVYEAAFKDGNIDRAALSVLYSHLQNLVGNFARELGSDFEKYDLVLKRTLYLRYWDNVTKHFTETYGAAVKAGYEAASGTMPKWSGMTRDKALAAIASYPGKSGDEALTLLVEFLRDLNPEKVPVTWA
ncbi:MAG: DUF4157 domain-containing protein [Deltaproteobacteria bacterium]|nr:DUF4157 domain-containing protein [Deltaproteobacteria bacterium]